MSTLLGAHSSFTSCSEVYDAHLQFFGATLHNLDMLSLLTTMHCRTYCAKIGRGGGDNGDVGVRRWQIGGGYRQQRQRGTEESLPRQIG